MRKKRRVALELFLIAAGALALPDFARAQVVPQQMPGLDPGVAQPLGLPQLPPQGAWGEIINATSRWIVIQNHSGQQYPIASQDINEFLVRWPTSLEKLTPASLVEAVGRDIGSNVIEVNHVDVFEGSDRSLVAPMNNSQLAANNNPFAFATSVYPGFNMINPWDYSSQWLMYGWAYPSLQGALAGDGSQIRVAGPVTQRSPLQVSVPGNNLATLVGPGNGPFSMTQVTRGAMNMVKKGDFAFLMPQQIHAKGLTVSQFVLYKTISYAQFIARK